MIAHIFIFTLYEPFKKRIYISLADLKSSSLVCCGYAQTVIEMFIETCGFWCQQNSCHYLKTIWTVDDA